MSPETGISTPATYPNADGDGVLFGSAITADTTILLQDAVPTAVFPVVGNMTFDNANKYTIGGVGDLTLANTGTGLIGISVANGSHEVSAALTLLNDVAADIGGANTLTFSNVVGDPAQTGASRRPAPAR